MLSLTKAWECDIWPHALRLRLGKKVIARHERVAGETLDTALSMLFRLRSPSFPWRDSVAFNVDTDDLMLMVVPWQPGVATPQELLQLAQLQVMQHDSAALHKGGWMMRFESACWQQPALVSGVQHACWERLQTLARREKLRFRGIETPFQRLLKYSRRTFPEKALFITISAHQCRIASRINRAWHEVSTISLPQQETVTQLRVIAQLSGMTDCSHYLLNTEEGEPQIITPQEKGV